MDSSSKSVSEAVIGASIAIHRALGPGLLESAYAACLTYELAKRGVSFAREVAVPVVYEGVRLDCGYRVDFVVERSLVVEIKAVAKLLPIHSAQVITYLRLLQIDDGLLINFNVHLLRHGLRRLSRTAPHANFLDADDNPGEPSPPLLPVKPKP